MNNYACFCEYPSDDNTNGVILKQGELNSAAPRMRP